jgi:LuxR family transcriptional regulator
MYLITHKFIDTNWLGVFIEKIKNCQSEEDIFKLILREIKTLEFEDCVFGASLGIPVTRENILYLSSLPKDWQERYKKLGHITIDPRIIHGRSSQKPFIWNVEKMESDIVKKLSPSQNIMWEDLLDNEIRSGIALSTYMPTGSGSMLIVSRSKQNILPKEFNLAIKRLDIILQIGHVEFLKRRQSKVGSILLLTPQEKEVLRWTCDGKTSSEIGEILNISTDTVNFHIKNSVKKLSVPNKTAAAVSAFSLGMLF